MEIVGTVVSVKGDMATVKVKRVSACGENCAHCSGVCETTTTKSIVQNTAGAKVGDTVKIESNSTDVLRAAFALYVVPVLVAIIMAVITYGIKMPDFLVILISVFSFFCAFVVIKHFEKKLVPKSYITKILGRSVS